MLNLRKDVKLGLVIGAIVLSVIGVYLVLTAIAGSGPRQVAGAQLLTETSAGTPTKSEPAVTPRPERALRTNVSTPPTTPTRTPVTEGTDPANPAPPVRADPWASYDFGSNTITGTTRDRVPTDAPGAQQGERASTGVAAPAGAPSATQEYVIQPGDTFSSVAQQFYGDARHFNLIVQANPNVNPNKLKLGTKIAIPPLPATAQKEPKDDIADVSATPLDASRQYRVQPGDTLSRIASTLYNDSRKWNAIWESNKKTLPDPTKLKPGMILILPEAPTQTASTGR